MRIETRDLSVRYCDMLALDGLSLNTRPGEILAIIGPNGSGKSSLIKAIAGLVKAEGEVLFDGARHRPACIGYMAQDIAGRAALTVMEAVLLGRLGQLGLRLRPEDIRAASRILTELDLVHLAARYLGELSGGQRQIVYLAQALAAEPRILLLDEPISALDLRHQIEVLGVVHELTRGRQLTTVCVLHDLNAAARFADRLALMCEGRLVAFGAPAEVLTARDIRRAFEVEADVRPGHDGNPVITAVRSARRTVG